MARHKKSAKAASAAKDNLTPVCRVLSREIALFKRDRPLYRDRGREHYRRYMRMALAACERGDAAEMVSTLIAVGYESARGDEGYYDDED